MSFEWWTTVRRKVKALLKRRQFERDLQDEIAFHLEMRERKLRVSVTGEEDIQMSARRRFGNPTRLAEETRAVWVFGWLESLFRDLCYAARSLRKSPGLVAVVVLSLALGIAANSTMFSVLNAEMYRPLPYWQPDRLMVIWQVERGRPKTENGPAIAEVVDWNQQNHTFEEISQTSGVEAAPLSRLGSPELIPVQDVTPNFFHVLRVEPETGRVFTAEEAQDRVQTVVVSDVFAKRYFRTVSNALGKTFVLAGLESTVVGIMPPGFTSFYGEEVDVWQPINPASARYAARKDGGWLMPLGRLKAGASIAEAKADMSAVGYRMEQAYPAIDKGLDDKVIPLQEELSGWARILYPLVGAVGFVLLIACLNVANLLQSRSETRRKEKAVRASLGASRGRLIQQLLIESGLLAFCGGVLGLALTYAGIRVFLSLAGEFPNSHAIQIDWRVMLFTGVLSLVTALLFGIAPALQFSNPDLQAVLRAGERRTVAGSRRNVRHLLVISEVALATVLLVGAGLMIKTVFRMSQIDPGYDPRNVLTATVSLAEGGKYVELIPGSDDQKAMPAVRVFYERLIAEAAALPGIESAATISRNFRGCTFSILGRPAPALERRPDAAYAEVSSGFFRTLRIPLKRGRYINDADGPGSPWVAVVNEAFARRYFPNEDPVGHRLLMRFESYHVDEPRPREIVGVVGDTKLYRRAQSVEPMIYCSFRQQPDIYPGGATMAHIEQRILVRVAPPLMNHSSQVGAELRKASAKVDPDQPLTDVITLEQQLAKSMEDTQFVMHLLEIFAGIALLLAAVGIYGVMSYFVGQRTHEIGIRVALGAERANVMGLVTGFGLKLALIGLALGSGLALALTRVLERFLFEVSATDLPTFAGVALVLAAIALLACYLPGLRAIRVDPMVALRHE